MKPIIMITLLITMMLMGAPMLNDTLTHTGSDKEVAEKSLFSGTQDAEISKTTADKPEVQSAAKYQNSIEAAGTLPGKNTANLIIIL